MHFFNKEIENKLNDHNRGSHVSFIGLGKYNFDLALDYISLQAEYRVDFLINGIEASWTGGSCDAPVWLLIGQRPKSIELESNDRLIFFFEGGDRITIYTENGPHECVHFGIGIAEEVEHFFF